MEFTKDWHGRHIKHWLELLYIYVNKPTKYLEIGVFEGRSITWMLENILTHKQSTAVGIDSWVNKSAEYKRAMRNTSKYGKKCLLIKDTSINILSSDKINDNSVDIVYIDGDHVSSAVLNDTKLCWPKIKNDGLMIFDDYGLSPDKCNRGIDGIPRTAIDKIIKSYPNEIIFKNGKQVFIKKIMPMMFVPHMKVGI